MNTERTARLLRELRGKRTQAQIAEALGLKTSAISMYENGKRFPSDEVKKKYADLFGRTVQFIFFMD